MIATRKQTRAQVQAMAEEEYRRRLTDKPSWQDWPATLFPNLFYQPMGDNHLDFWQHINSIEPGTKPPAFFAIWARGGGKTSNAEAATVFLGGENRRKFCLYTRSIQDKANESVANIAALLESKQVARHYPLLAERKLGKYGNSKGWRVDTLRCANGFNVVALGYDAAVRGIKIEEYRPDLIIIDDIDEKGDSLDSIEKKVKTLTNDILPAGSRDAAVIGIQNLIHFHGIFKRIADGKVDFLHERIVSGPFPAIDGLEYEARSGGGYHITGGTPIWRGQDLATCEAQINEWGLDAFLEEAQHLVTLKKGRVYHGFVGAGPDAATLDYSKVSGYYTSHDFGAITSPND